MSLSCGIVGLPNVGKSTIFNALASAKAEAANFPFTTINPNTGIVRVPDRRLSDIAALIPRETVTPATVTFIDIAGLVRGASKGEGLGNQFLGHIRDVTAVAHVVRCFADDAVVHVEGSIDPLRDVATVDTELMLADLEVVTRRYATIEKTARSGDKQAAAVFGVLKRVREALEAGRPVRSLSLPPEDLVHMRDYALVTQKKVMYIANVAEADIRNPGANRFVQALEGHASREGSPVVAICGKVEAEIAELEGGEKAQFLKDYGLEEPGLDRAVRAAYGLLDLVTFFTTTGKELRAWPVPRGIKAPQAAGVIHTDFERGFIKAEVCRYEELMEKKSEHLIREAGHMRVEGKDYAIQDGDIVLFRFNV